MANPVMTGALSVPVEKIHAPGNVRELDQQHVDALAGSIALQGLLTPILLTPTVKEGVADGLEYELVAGFHRYAAVCKLGHPQIDAVIRTAVDDGDQPSAVAQARATENIARKQLDAYEEAVAVAAMLDRGLTEDGAAQALGWPKVRITARIKLLELPELAQQMVGDGRIPLSAVDQLRQIGQISPKLLVAVVDYLADGNAWMAERLAREPGWVLDAAMRQTGIKTFAAHLSRVDSHELAGLKLGKKAEALVTEASEIHRKLNRDSYSGPAFEFAEQDVDQARAAGVLIEFENSRPIIVDRSLYRELCKQAVKRTVEQLRTKQIEVEQQRKASQAAGKLQTLADPAAEAKRDHGRRLRQLAEQAHGVNTDIGWSLRNGLATVDPADKSVAAFFVYGLLGSDYMPGGYGKAGETVVELAMTGIRLVIDEFRQDVTNVKKDGSRGVLRIDYGDAHKPADAVTWLWKYIDASRTAADLYGRALVVICAQQYASRLVVPASQQHRPLGWASHQDRAAKALAKLAGPHLPASLKQLQKAVAKAHADYEQQLAAAQAASRNEHVDEPTAVADSELEQDTAGTEIDEEQIETAA